jgi:hypothetical protein
MSDARTYAVLHFDREVADLVLSRHVVPSAIDVTERVPQPLIGWRYDRATDAFVPPPAFSRPESHVKREAIARVNQLAGECRARYLTTVPGQAETYLLKSDELEAYDAAVAAGQPILPAAYPILFTEALATGTTLAETADLVRTTRAQWVQLAAVVEGMRRGAIVAIEQATTEAAVRAAIPESWP